MAASPTTPSFSLPGWANYLALAILLVGSVVASYWLKIFPTAFGQIGGGASIVAIFTFAAHDFEDEGLPSGFPRWTSFVVVSIASVGMGAIGAFTGTTLLTIGAFATWLTLALGLLYHILANDGGSTFSLNAETWACAFIGAAVTLGVWFIDNPTAGLAAAIGAAIPILGTYFHVAGGTVTPAPNPPAPPVPT
jgi:hypothetical protein